MKWYGTLSRSAILRALALIVRVCVGVPLLGATGFVSALAIDFAIVEYQFWDRCAFGLVGLFFAVQAYVVCNILLFRFQARPQPGLQLSFPPSNGPGFAGAPVPVSPKPMLPTLSAAAQLPREGVA